MKKVVVIALAVVTLVLAGLGIAYYLGYFNQDETEAIVPRTHPDLQNTNDDAPSDIVVEQPSPPPLPEYYFVARSFENVLTQPDLASATDGVAYYGEKLKVLEREGEWIRIAPIYQLEEGAEEISQWVNTKHLVIKEVNLSGERWLNVLTDYIEGSDDFVLYQEKFFDASTKLVKQKRCRLSDFEELSGWVKSINHQDSVYFTYCGGIESENKVYLNVATGELF
ncbi:hypothetical protein [Vibrio mediterranei]|uniref:hypothetical protein n=1 Tax=Vibrio mediterranei TaxID=689 RepID=UPI00125FFD50|nr:hypothetical protein [Vibrio mediterranei]